MQANRRLRLRLGLVAAATVLLFCSSGHSAHAAPICPRTTVEPAPGWLTSAVWLPPQQGGGSQGTILAIDAQAEPRGRLLAITPAGKASLLPQAGDSGPALLGSLPQGPILRHLGVDTEALNGLSGAGAPLDFLRKASAPEGKVGSIYQWVALGRTGSMLAFGSLRNPALKGGYELGFLRIPASIAGQTDILAPKPPLPGDFFLLGPPYQYVAAVGDVGVYVMMRSQNRVEFYLLPPGAKDAMPLTVEGIPDRFMEIGEFNGVIHSPAAAPALYQTLEGMDLIAGIYGAPDGKQLLVLTRHPKARNQTEWQVLRVMPASAPAPWRVVGKFTLPTTAAELIPVVSPGNFFVIERQDLLANGRATIREMVRVPMDLIYKAGMAGATCGP